MSLWNTKSAVKAILKRIDDAKALAKRDDKIRLLAVSKGQTIERLEAFYELGFREFAESYGNELFEKAEALKGIRWVFIGRLQSNKIRKIVEACDEIQSLCDMKHANKIAQSAKEFGKTPFPVFISVNAANEPSKAGVPLHHLASFCKQLEALPELQVMGVMAIPPKADQYQGDLAQVYANLKAASLQTGEGLLSLGMSSDLELAILHGSHCVRIGEALMGPRNYSKPAKEK